MKRCPRCSFIYEDDQRLCDLDGGELVLASGTLPPPVLAVPRQVVPSARTRRSGSPFLPLAAVSLAAVLFSIYYLIPQRPALRAADQSSPATLAATPQPAPKSSQAPTPAAFSPPSAPSSPAVTKVKATKPVALMPKRPHEAARTPLPTQEQKKPEPEATSPKKESRLGSILKKTGRLLKKPFKF